MSGAATAVGAAGRRPPRPWTPLAWVTWRQQRAALATFAVLYGAFALVMVYAGVEVHGAYATLVAQHCSVASPLGRCGRASALFLGQPYDLYPNAVALALHIGPVLFGTFVGAPLLAREYEAGTLRFCWTQGIGRTRWAVAQSGLLAIAATAVAGGLAALATWSAQPFAALGYTSRWQAGQFDTTVITAAGWALAAFAAGVLLGTVIKRTVAAMAATAMVATAAAALASWRLDYLLFGIGPRTVADPSLLTASYRLGDIGTYAQQAYPGPPGSWLVRGWLADPSGQRLGHGRVSAVMHLLFGNKPSAAVRWLAQRHDSFLVAYQPAGRFWLFQSAAGAVLLLAAAACLAATLLLIRRPS